MKKLLKTPDKNSIKETAINVTSATVGGMLSEGVVNIIPAKTLAEYEDYVRGGLALTSAVAAASIKGNSQTAQAAKWFLGGMSIAQILKLLPKLASKIGVSTPTADAKTSEKFISGVFGLQCPCESSYDANKAVVRMPMLNGASAFDYPGQKLENLGFQKNQPIAVNAFD